jgi:O-antigen/teichoic acid export membrane protein
MIGAFANAHSRLKASLLARRFLNGAAWSIFGSVVSSGVTLIMLMLVARLLGKEIYGQFVVIQSTLSMVGVFAGFGIGVAATHYTAELRTRDTVRLSHILTLAQRTILGFGFLASTGMVFAADWMASRIFNDPSLSVPLGISACAVLFTTLDSYQKSMLIGFEAMRAFAIGTVLGVVAGFPIMLLAVNNFGLQGAAVAMVINALLQTSISRYQMARELLKNKIQYGTKGCLSEWPVLWRFAFPVLVAGVLVGPVHWAAQAFLSNTPNGYAELAVLGIAMQWFNVIMFIPSTSGRVILPILTDYVTKNDHSNSRKILLYAMIANASVAVPLAIIVGVFSSNIMGLYGSSFEHDYVPLVLAAMTAALLAAQIPVGNLLIASSRVWLGALMNAVWAFVYVTLAYFLASKGASGIILALGVGYVVHASWTFWFALYQLRIVRI